MAVRPLSVAATNTALPASRPISRAPTASTSVTPPPTSKDAAVANSPDAVRLRSVAARTRPMARTASTG